MLRKIETKELLTRNEARKKYSKNYIIMEIVEVVDGHDNDLGYVLYTVDKKKEMRMIPRSEYSDGRIISYVMGEEFEPFGINSSFLVYHG